MQNKSSIIPLFNPPTSYNHFVGYRRFLWYLTSSMIVIWSSFSATIRFSLSLSVPIFSSLASSSLIRFKSSVGKGVVEPVFLAILYQVRMVFGEILCRLATTATFPTSWHSRNISSLNSLVKSFLVTKPPPDLNDRR